MKNYAVALLFIVLLAGCDSTQPSDHVEDVVVEAYLIAGEPLPDVWLSRSIPVNGVFDADRGGFPGADVRIHLLGSDGQPESTWSYEAVFGAAGQYTPPSSDARILPGRRYRLEAVIPDRDPVTAETTVPGDYRLVEVGPLELAYRQADQLEFVVTPIERGNRAPVYIFSIESLDPRPSNLTPLYLDFIYDLGDGDPVVDEELDPSEMDAVLFNSSPPINEGNYEQRPDGLLSVRLPWFAVAFYGPTRVIMSALDDNVYDFVRYQQVQAGGSTLSPGEIPNVLDRVENGRGLFGSVTRVEATVTIQR
ncbi:MAG: DUF4249 family protein [Rhodothermales bacterium]